MPDLAEGRPLPLEWESRSEAFIRILTRQAQLLGPLRMALLQAWNVEILHDFRVALRRTRFALKLLRKTANPPSPLRPSCLRLDRILQQTAHPLGQIRDLDLLMERLESWEALSEPDGLRALFTNLRGQRQELQRICSPLLQSGFFGDALTELRSSPSWIPSTSCPVRYELADWIWDAARPIHEIRTLHPGSFTDEALHRLRIQLKGLRYTCEFFQGHFASDFKAHIAWIVRFQDILGRLQDHRSALSILPKLASIPDKQLAFMVELEKSGWLGQRLAFQQLWIRSTHAWEKRFKDCRPASFV